MLLMDTKATSVTTNRSRPEASVPVRLSLCAAAALLALSIATESAAQDEMAQSLHDEQGMAPIVSGRSVAYYGIEGDVEQRASIRAVLSSAQLDRVRYVPDVVNAGATFVLRLFIGGGGAPADLAASQKDVANLLRE